VEVPDPKNIKRLVVRGTNWVGDAVMTVPALRELRSLLPDAHITLATRSWARGLFADADFLDDLLIYDRRGLGSVAKQIRHWRDRSFDLALLFQNAFEAAVIPLLARIPLRIGYATDARRLLLSHPLQVPEWHNSRHEIFYYLNIVGELEQLLYRQSTVLSRAPNSAIAVSDGRKTKALSLLRINGLHSEGPLVAMCPGSINSRAKRWPAERYAELADSLMEKLNAEILLIGSPAELDVSQEVARRMCNQPIVLTGKTDLAELTSVLSLVDLLVTNDTGAAHIAAALARPTLVIFGPTNPLTTRPFSPLAEVVRHPPDCAPCMLRDCPIDHRCMTAITPDEIFARAHLLLAVPPHAETDRNVRPTGALA
jgi:heptosyltransferase II